ncbi:uncharacterized protein EI90DRAFT_461697 [Cantharellus anzutake]|uniref:uncharacterized protein n=1 Tax=Cantharellus anzutake TaxID=1750568 RepID=UPI001908DD08|nr:uncharacterized protein EI90DRAFT_461697 [Cantharellus anzutake]KAF8334768.1 hypothetical protein EI90DRAFT_461697 [Cantharellus anzutake]
MALECEIKCGSQKALSEMSTSFFYFAHPRPRLSNDLISYSQLNYSFKSGDRSNSRTLEKCGIRHIKGTSVTLDAFTMMISLQYSQSRASTFPLRRDTRVVPISGGKVRVKGSVLKRFDGRGDVSFVSVCVRVCWMNAEDREEVNYRNYRQLVVGASGSEDGTT